MIYRTYDFVRVTSDIKDDHGRVLIPKNDVAIVTGILPSFLKMIGVTQYDDYEALMQSRMSVITPADFPKVIVSTSEVYLMCRVDPHEF